jgi:hypothetical protein
VVSQDKGAGTATAIHAYAEPGTYELVIRVHDDDVGMTRVMTTVSVSVPDGRRDRS